MAQAHAESNELEAILNQALDYSRLTKRELAQRSQLAPETLSRIGTRGTADFQTVAKLVRSAGMEIAIRPATRRDDRHQRLDARSLALHTLIAGKLAGDPALIHEKVLPNIARFRAVHHGSGTDTLLRIWEKAAQAGLPALLRFCIDPSEHGQQLRQTSPLTGILTLEERKSVYDAYAA
ncbi:MAG: hypothetical protein ACREVL_00030 [Solimonas sp.]